MNILVIAAHPDDEVLGCGGTIARYTQEGHNVSVIILSQGIASRYKNKELVDSVEFDTLQTQSRKALKLLEIENIRYFDFPDNRFDTIPLLDIIKPIEEVIQHFSPEIIFTHYGGDLNIDHAVTYRAALTAARPIRDCSVKKFYSFEIPSSTEWAFGKFNSNCQPSYFVDIKSTIEKKIEALKEYKGELRPYPHPRSEEAVLSISKKWGCSVGLDFAEAFYPTYQIR